MKYFYEAARGEERMTKLKCSGGIFLAGRGLSGPGAKMTFSFGRPSQVVTIWWEENKSTLCINSWQESANLIHINIQYQCSVQYKGCALSCWDQSWFLL